MKDLITKEQAIDIHNIDGEPTMSSLRIAEVTGKQHNHVRRDIEKVFSECEIDTSKFGHIYLDGSNRKQKHYLLPERELNLVISGYSAKYRLQLIDELMSYRKNSNKQLTTEDILALTAKKLEEVEEKRKHTQKLLEETKRINEVLEQEIEAIANTDGLIDMKAFSMLVTSRTQEVNFGRTKCYLVLRALNLVGKDTRPTQYGLTSYLEVKMVEGSDGKLYPKTFVIADKFDKLFNRIVKKVLEDEELNRELGYPFGK